MQGAGSFFLIYLLRLEPLRLLLALLLMLLLRSEAGDRFLGDGERSSFPRGDRSLLPFVASGSGLDMLYLQSYNTLAR